MFQSLRATKPLEHGTDESSEIPSFIELYWLPEIYVHVSDDETYRKYKLSLLQRIFLTLESPASSLLAESISFISIAAILLTVFSLIISTLPSLMVTPDSCRDPVCQDDTHCIGQTICTPQPMRVFRYIDNACAVLFFIDFFVRSVLCGIMPTRLSGTLPDDWDELEKERSSKNNRPVQTDPQWNTLTQYALYMFSFHTVIDVLSILPAFLEMVISVGTLHREVSVIRILRLVRIFRILRVNTRGRMIVKLLHNTMSQSREAIAILLFYLAVVVIFFADFIYTVEQGNYEYDDLTGEFAFLRTDGIGGMQRSPFTSIPTSIYYTVITLTTIGYGDLAPTTVAGRAFASACAILSVLVLALPITIIGSNFSKQYDGYIIRVQSLVKKMKLKKLALKKKVYGKARSSITSMMDDQSGLSKKVHNQTMALIQRIRQYNSSELNQSSGEGMNSNNIELEYKQEYFHDDDSDINKLGTGTPIQSRQHVRDIIKSIELPGIYPQSSKESLQSVKSANPDQKSVLFYSQNRDDNHDGSHYENHNGSHHDNNDDSHKTSEIGDGRSVRVKTRAPLQSNFPVARFFTNAAAWTGSVASASVRFRPQSSQRLDRESDHSPQHSTLFGSRRAFEIGTLTEDSDEENDGDDGDGESECLAARAELSTRAGMDHSLHIYLDPSDADIESMPRDQLIQGLLLFRRDHHDRKARFSKDLEGLLEKYKGA